MDLGKNEYRSAKFRNLIWVSMRKIVGHRRFYRTKYYDKRIEGYDYANQKIRNALDGNEPFLAARFGDAELRTIVYTIEIKLGLRREFPDYIKGAMNLNAGFFPATDDNLVKFGEIMLESCGQVDLFGVWFNLLEDYVIHKYNERADLVRLEALEPYRNDNPWSYALRGKKVLVVHPFSESIKNQYQIHDKLFENREVLPDFDLITYKTVQTNAGGTCDYESWFEALEAMCSDIKEKDFDIAIVGCGSYGLPLAAKIKDMNKKVIHLAGATQLLFGIRGARWDTRPEMQYLFNEYWIRPAEFEKPISADQVEGGCYW